MPAILKNNTKPGTFPGERRGWGRPNENTSEVFFRRYGDKGANNVAKKTPKRNKNLLDKVAELKRQGQGRANLNGCKDEDKDKLITDSESYNHERMYKDNSNEDTELDNGRNGYETRNQGRERRWQSVKNESEKNCSDNDRPKRYRCLFGNCHGGIKSTSSCSRVHQKLRGTPESLESAKGNIADIWILLICLW